MALVGCVLILWALAPRLGVPRYVWPSLDAVVQALKQGFVDMPQRYGIGSPSGLPYHTGVTLAATVLGYLIGVSVAVTLAVVAAEFPVVEGAVRPLLSAFQAVPKIAIAPLFLIWFGFGSVGRVALASTLVFFPVMMNALAGLKFVPPEALDLAEMVKASRWRTLWLIKLPYSLPHLLTGLRLGAVYAFLATISSEFLAGYSGLGAKLVEAQTMMNTSTAVAIVVVLGVFGALFEGTLARLGKSLLFWADRGEA